MKPVTKLAALLTGATFLGGIGGAEVQRRMEPRYYWYDVAHVDSLRDILNRVGPAQMRMEERTKKHVWMVVMPTDTTARFAGPLEVEESTWCPPNCLLIRP